MYFPIISSVLFNKIKFKIKLKIFFNTVLLSFLKRFNHQPCLPTVHQPFPNRLTISLPLSVKLKGLGTVSEWFGTGLGTVWDVASTNQDQKKCNVITMHTIYQKFEIPANNKYIIVYINSFNNSLVRTEAPLPRLDRDDIIGCLMNAIVMAERSIKL